MKVKLGDLTARQMYNVCLKHKSCDGSCPLFGLCDNEPYLYDLSKEINLSDEESEDEDDE